MRVPGLPSTIFRRDPGRHARFAPRACACPHRVQRRSRRGRGRRQGEAEVPRPRRLAAAREPHPRACVLPRLDARSARRRHRGPLEQHRLGLADRSYLIGFIWFERGSGELHVNLRGYPGPDRDPDAAPATSARDKCRASPTRTATSARTGIDATVYTVNQGADQWHVLFAWHRGGSLYTLSQHVARAADLRDGRRRLSGCCATRRSSRPRYEVHAPRSSSPARRPGRSGRPGSTRWSTSWRRRRARADALGLPPEQHLLDLRVVHDNGIAVIVPPLHHQLVTARVRRERPGERPTRARGRAGRARRPLRADARGARRHRRLGAARTSSAACPAALGEARPARPAGRQAALLAGDPLPERPARRRARAERRRRAAAQRLAGPRRRRREGALRGPRRLRADEHSQGVRRRRLRGRPEPAEADGDGRGRARRRPDPGHRPSSSSASPRPSGRTSARAGSRTSRRSATRTRPAATSTAAPTCTSRTSSRTSRPGT